MVNRNLINYSKVAKSAVLEIGDYLNRKFGSTKQILCKKELNIGIKEDTEADNFYQRLLKKETPNIKYYSEEKKISSLNDLVWVVDSIEGTSNYRVGNPFWATQVCLLDNNTPMVSAVFAPALDQLFTATDKGGAYLNDRKINVSKTELLSNSLVTVGKGTRKKDIDWYIKAVPKILKKVRTFRYYGTCGLELSYVAAGMIDAFINSGSKLYDYAAGALLVRESGGVVLNFSKKNWTISDINLIATNKSLFKAIFNYLP